MLRLRSVTCDGYMLQFVFKGTLLLSDSSSTILERLILDALLSWTSDKVATVVFYVILAKYDD